MVGLPALLPRGLGALHLYHPGATVESAFCFSLVFPAPGHLFAKCFPPPDPLFDLASPKYLGFQGPLIRPFVTPSLILRNQRSFNRRRAVHSSAFSVFCCWWLAFVL